MKLIDADELREKVHISVFDADDCEWIESLIANAPTIEPPTKCIAQINVDIEKVIERVMERIKKEHELNQAWIPVNKELPKTIGEYLITVLSNPSKNHVVSTGYFHERIKEFGTFRIDGTWEKWDVIAWMPLPKPWEGE